MCVYAYIGSEKKTTKIFLADGLLEAKYPTQQPCVISKKNPEATATLWADLNGFGGLATLAGGQPGVRLLWF